MTTRDTASSDRSPSGSRTPSLQARLREHAEECNIRYSDWARDLRDAATALDGSHAEIAQLREGLTSLREWFAYGQHEHTGMSAVATPRCSPSAWKEIKTRVEEALAVSRPVLRGEAQS